MRPIVSIILENLEFLDPAQGANFVGPAVKFPDRFRRILLDERVEALEVFVHPLVVSEPGKLLEIANNVLPAHRRGQGVLRFYPFTSLPLVWKDPHPRIHHCFDPVNLARDRALRDRLAAGPTAIYCTSSSHGIKEVWAPLQRLAEAGRVEFDAIVSPSTFTTAAYEASFRALVPGAELPCRMETVPNGVDLDQFQPATPELRAQAKAAFRIPADSPTLLYFGRISPHAKSDLIPVLRAFAAAKVPNGVLLISGKENAPGYVDHLRSIAAELGISGQVRFEGPIPLTFRHLPYQAADAFLFPSDTIQEAFGNVLVEAIASGVPVISTDWDGARDIVRHKENGLLVPIYFCEQLDRVSAVSPLLDLDTNYMLFSQSAVIDEVALSRAMSEMLTQPELRAGLADGARKSAERFAMGPVYERFFALSSELLAAAQSESEDAKVARRAAVDAWSPVPPYAQSFAGYSTWRIADDRKLELGLNGKAAKRGVPISFYNEMAPVIETAAVGTAIEAVSKPGATFGSVVGQVARTHALSDSDARYLVHVLIKNGGINFSTDIY